MSESLLASEDGGDPSEFQFIHELAGSPGATSTMKYPPPVTYLPSFDYSLQSDYDPPETKDSPFNYPMTPAKNKVFYNPFMSRSNKRMLNISNSSVGSNCSYYAPISKRLKFLKHDASVCSENCDSTLERSLSFLNNTTVEVEEEGKQLRQGTNNNQEAKVVLCSSCTDLSPSVAECLSCSLSLCQLCLAAHRRVRLTKEHDIKIINTDNQAAPGVPLLRSLKCMVDLVQMTSRHKCLNLDEAIDSCISEALDFKSDNPDVKLAAEDDKVLQDLLSIELLPLLHEDSVEVRQQVMKVLQAVFELELSVKDPASLVTDSCLEAFKMVLSSPPEQSDRISLTLDCLSTILVQLVPQQYLVKTMQDKLVPVLSKLKEGERDHNINVKFKASKLSRQIMKALA